MLGFETLGEVTLGEIKAEATTPGFIAAWCLGNNSVLGFGMKKNVAGQKIGAQLVAATDGSAFTGSVVAYVTGDAGTQAAGSVGAGACTHEGNGYHTYAPSQAETNYALIGFTFVGSGAVPASVQVFTDSLPDDPADASDIAAAFSTVNGTLSTIAGYIDTEIGTLITSIGTGLNTAVLAVKAKTDNLPAAPAAVSDIPTANANADALLDRAAGVETGLTFRQAMRGLASVLLSKLSGAGTATEVFRDFGDSKARITATVDSSGNRTAITRDLT